ncbi:MAG: non-canonical purine NTP pyrophosphatase, RdgB/HAM1 family [Pelagibacteraceae bacterium TMED216]|nr:MAG: non-canonical purine NTP pyrophosphatase, RdgB/HAM1 family [Pelagibacteraceae bacterium TMED216]|tara:strand:- start:392 stop:979 length:588 start_codon:yes stop_codon:yes gene_type:complete
MKKKVTILIGTHNKGKFKEISQLLPKRLIKVSPIQLKIKSPKETGKTFKANSQLKANYFFNKSKKITLSDDSGIEIYALKKKPGIFSARWSKKYGSFRKAMEIILKKLKNKNNRKARFICSLTLQISKKKIYTREGLIEGKISKNIIGTNGFGYDPIFIPKGKKITFGQMQKVKKYKMDHRFLAYKKIKKKITAL